MDQTHSNPPKVYNLSSPSSIAAPEDRRCFDRARMDRSTFQSIHCQHTLANWSTLSRSIWSYEPSYFRDSNIRRPIFASVEPNQLCASLRSFIWLVGCTDNEPNTPGLPSTVKEGTFASCPDVPTVSGYSANSELSTTSYAAPYWPPTSYSHNSLPLSMPHWLTQACQ